MQTTGSNGFDGFEESGHVSEWHPGMGWKQARDIMISFQGEVQDLMWLKRDPFLCPFLEPCSLEENEEQMSHVDSDPTGHIALDAEMGQAPTPQGQTKAYLHMLDARADRGAAMNAQSYYSSARRS